MGKSQGIRTSKSGLYWCNIILSTGKHKLVIAELIDEDNMLFRLLSNSGKMRDEPGWESHGKKTGWFYLDIFEEDINEFFDYMY